jgi:hypothetical protein
VSGTFSSYTLDFVEQNQSAAARGVADSRVAIFANELLFDRRQRADVRGVAVGGVAGRR